MSTFPFRQLLRSRWENFARLVWPPTRRRQTPSERNHLSEELRRRQRCLLQCRQKIEKLRDYLHRCERRLHLLASLARDGTSLEALARRRRTIDRLRERLQDCEGAYDHLLARFQRRDQRWAELGDPLGSSPLSRRITNHED
jgi:flagellar biosynthesis chaperone FliJ